MHRITKRLTYSNVMSSIAVFLVLGGAAFAVGRLPRHSVGVKQLKAGAVTAAKLHKNAVTNAKIKEGAVDGGKIADGSVSGADINAESTPFGRVVARLRGNTALALTGEFQVFPLNPYTYTQAADEVDTYVGATDITFSSDCKAPRKATAFVVVDAPSPTKEEEKIVGAGQIRNSGTGAVNARVEIAPAFFEPGVITGYRFEPGTAKSHTVSLVVQGECEGGGSGITATFGGLDVIGTK